MILLTSLCRYSYCFYAFYRVEVGIVPRICRWYGGNRVDDFSRKVAQKENICLKSMLYLPSERVAVRRAVKSRATDTYSRVHHGNATFGDWLLSHIRGRWFRKMLLI